jgi:hypothetical protein
LVAIAAHISFIVLVTSTTFSSCNAPMMPLFEELMILSTQLSPHSSDLQKMVSEKSGFGVNSAMLLQLDANNHYLILCLLTSHQDGNPNS